MQTRRVQPLAALLALVGLVATFFALPAAPAAADDPVAVPVLQYEQDFSVDATDWSAAAHDAGTGTATVSGGSYSYFGGLASQSEYRQGSFEHGMVTELDVYLDPAAMSVGQGFDLTVAVTRKGDLATPGRDFIFHVGKVSGTDPRLPGDDDAVLVNGSNNTDGNVNPYKLFNENGGNYSVIDEAGWYTFQHSFRIDDGALAGDLNVLDAEGEVVFTATRRNPADVAANVGGVRYQWFTFATGSFPIDNQRLFHNEVAPLASSSSVVSVSGGPFEVKDFAAVSVEVSADDVTPSGDVVFAVGGVDVATVALDGAGRASALVQLGDAGDVSVSATYLGSDGLAGSSDAVVVEVAEAPEGAAVTGSITVGGVEGTAPSGTVFTGSYEPSTGELVGGFWYPGTVVTGSVSGVPVSVALKVAAVADGAGAVAPDGSASVAGTQVAFEIVGVGLAGGALVPVSDCTYGPVELALAGQVEDDGSLTLADDAFVIEPIDSGACDGSAGLFNSVLTGGSLSLNIAGDFTPPLASSSSVVSVSGGPFEVKDFAAVSVEVSADDVTPSGDVVFAVGGVDVATVALDGAGRASALVQLGDAGDVSVSATYLGSDGLAGSSDAVVVEVAEAPEGAAVTGSITVGGVEGTAPSGTVFTGSYEPSTGELVGGFWYPGTVVTGSVSGVPVSVALKVAAVADGAGAVAPDGSASVAGTQVAFEIVGVGLAGGALVPVSDCTYGPVELALAGQVEDDGSLTLADDAFVIEPIDSGACDGSAGLFNSVLTGGSLSLNIAGDFTPPPPGAGAFGGTVTADGEPLAGARLRFYAEDSSVLLGQAFTGPDGTYLFDGLEPGGYKVRVTADGFVGQFWSGRVSFAGADVVTVIGGQTATADFELVSAGPGAFGGVVRSGGSPVEGARLRFYTQDSSVLLGQAFTGPDGTYLFDGLAQGGYKVRVTAAGYVGQFWNGKANFVTANVVNVIGGSTATANFSLAPTGGAVAGTVTGNGHGVPGALVRLYNSSAQIVSSTVTAANGSYSFNVAPGAYRVLVIDSSGDWVSPRWIGGGAFSSATVLNVVAEGSITGVDVELVPTGTAASVSGSVTEAGGPAAGMRVVLYNSDAQIVATVFSQPDGSFSFGNVQPGTYFVRVRELSTHADAWWDGRSSIRSATPIDVDTSVTGIDIVVTPLP